MAVLQSRLNLQTDTAKRNAENMSRLTAQLREALETARAGGGPEATEKHRKRNKMTARERVDALIDPKSFFLELSPLDAYDMYDGDAPGAGVVTGIGIVHGQHCV